MYRCHVCRGRWKPIEELRGHEEKVKHYWLTPPELYAKLNEEFHFDFDPCPEPRLEGFDGLSCEWGSSNWVNPPYRKYEGRGLCAWVRKAINEHRKGKTVVMVFPITQALAELAEYGIEIRSLGRVRWLAIEDGQPTNKPDSIGLFVLKGGRTAVCPRCNGKMRNDWGMPPDDYDNWVCDECGHESKLKDGEKDEK